MTPFSGLAATDAAARRTPFRIAIEVLREPMLALLHMSVAITVVQEARTERVLQPLRNDPLAVDQTPEPTGR